MDKKNLGEKIKAIRLSLGKTQEEFGKTLRPNASKGNVSSWESGRVYPNRRRLTQIASLAKTTPEKLLSDYPLGILNIFEATKQLKSGQALTRSSWHGLVIVPTNTEYCCEMYVNGQLRSSRWNPTKDDLVATDYKIVDFAKSNQEE